MIKFGYYRHFKGSIYVVTAIAKHSETGEELVVYHLAENHEKIWVRPLEMWNETVEHNGEIVQRFTKLD